MDFLVATDAGLFRVSGAGTMELLVEGAFRHVVAADEGYVALSADRTLWSIDEDGTAAEFDELTLSEPRCLVLDGDDVWVGGAGPSLLVIREGEHSRPNLEAVEGFATWTTPDGSVPAVHSMDVDDESTLYANIHVGGILRSTDGGDTWVPTIDVTADVHQVVTVPEFAKTVVAATARGMALSTDQGETWEFESAGLHATYSRAVAVAGDWVVVTVSDGPGGGRSAVYRRLLDNTEFIRCTEGLPEWFAGNIETHCLTAWDEEVALGVPGGILYASSDTGISWRPVVSNLPEIRAVAIM